MGEVNGETQAYEDEETNIRGGKEKQSAKRRAARFRTAWLTRTSGDNEQTKKQGTLGGRSATRSTGSTGAAGVKGTDGVAGVAGSDGVQGRTGETGRSGTDGVDGTPSAAGTNGVDGVSKGSKRRPTLVSQEQADRNYEAFLESSKKARQKEAREAFYDKQKKPSREAVDPLP